LTENSAAISQVVDIARRLNVAADNGISPPLCSVEIPLTAFAGGRAQAP
jgi:hypothetical protein